MRNFHLFLATLASVAALTATAGAANPFADASATKAKPGPKGQIGTLKAAGGAVAAPTQQLEQRTMKQATRKAARKAQRVQASDLKSPSLQIDYTTGTTEPAFKRACPVTYAISGNSIEIKGFGGYGKSATGSVDWQTGTVTVPRQSVYDSQNYGNCDIVKVNPNYTTIDTTAVITGRISGGVLTLDPWTLLITSGKYKGYILDGVRVRSDFKTANTTMNVGVTDTTGAVTSRDFPVIAEQTATNQVTLYNFAGTGSRVNVALHGDSTMAIAPQLILENNSARYKCYRYDPDKRLYYPYKQIKGSAKGGQLQWGNWIINSTDGKYYVMMSSGSSVKLPFELKLPAARTQAGFKGSGTEADPYLIENVGDLMALSDSVNFETDIDPVRRCGTKYAGQYFKQTATINMNGYKFSPIGGNDDYIRFGGTYDGNGKTISNLTVESVTDGYAALFGAVDTTGVLKNVRLTNPVIKSGYYYTGTLAAYCQGSIENVTVTGAKVEGNFCTGGVVGIVGPATNVTFSNGTVIGNSQTGGVAGVGRSPMKLLSATGATVISTATEYTTSVGGVVGFMGKERGGYLTDSYFAGTVVVQHAGVMAGCILGVSTEAPVSRCFAVGEIGYTGTSVGKTSAGGIVGGAQAMEITDCYFAGNNRLGGPQSGGLIGLNINVGLEGHADHSILTRCYVTGAIKSTSTDAQSPFVGKYDPQTGGSAPVINNCYYDGQLITANAKLTSAAVPTSRLVSGSAVDSTFSDTTWTFTKDLYPRLKSISANTAAYVSAAAAPFANDDQNIDNVAEDFKGSTLNGVQWKVLMNGALADDGHGLSVDKNGNFHLNGTFSADTIYASIGAVKKYIMVRCAPMSRFKGKGTAENPYLIENKDDLITLSKATVDNQLSFSGSYFRITNDIDVEKDQEFKGIGITGSSKSNYAFGGVLDGDNHTIHNVRLIYCTLDSTGKIATRENNTGFVNNLKAGGVVKNLRMASDCYFVGYSHTAAFVGHNYGGDIINCRNYATVIGHSGNTGGITGYHNAGLIKDCYNAGTIVAGFQYAGGIAAASRGTIENCQNTGEVIAKKINANYEVNRLNSAGGICHSNFGTMRNVLNTGHIKASKYVGGIMAWYNGKTADTMAVAALNVGIMEIDPKVDPTTIGNIIGKLYVKGKAKACYYDGQLSAYNSCHSAAYSGTEALSTAELTSGEPIEGLDTAYWSFEKGRYPMLRTFADEPGAQAGALSVVYFGDNHRSDSIKCDAALAQAEGLSWSTRAAGTAFQVKGNVLWMEPADVLADTIAASYQGFVKLIPVVATPDSVPTPAITVNGGASTVEFSCPLEGVTYHYTLDGSVPTAASSTSADGVVKLPAGTYTVTVIAAKHGHYTSQPVACEASMSGVEGVTAEKTVLTRSYVTPSGVVSPTPVDGLNIEVTTYTDGTRTAVKRLMQAK